MGCDIHAYREHWHPETERWESADRWVPWEIAAADYAHTGRPVPDEATIVAADAAIRARIAQTGSPLTPEDLAKDDGVGSAMTVRPSEEVCPGRNYTIFGQMAGVRGSGPPLVPPRGFPSDASPEVRCLVEAWGEDAHTPSWLTYAEILSVDAGAQWGHDDAECWAAWREHLFLRLMPTLPLDPVTGGGRPDWVRLVFWFDN